jgi:hypothetical protein
MNIIERRCKFRMANKQHSVEQPSNATLHGRRLGMIGVQFCLEAPILFI